MFQAHGHNSCLTLINTWREREQVVSDTVTDMWHRVHQPTAESRATKLTLSLQLMEVHVHTATICSHKAVSPIKEVCLDPSHLCGFNIQSQEASGSFNLKMNEQVAYALYSLSVFNFA